MICATWSLVPAGGSHRQRALQVVAAECVGPHSLNAVEVNHAVAAEVGAADGDAAIANWFSRKYLPEPAALPG